MPKPIAPEDKSITTVYIGNVGESITEKHLTDYFYQFGEIRSVNLIPKQNCAFVTYTTREATEAAIDKSFQKLTINGQKLIIKWGKSQAKKERQMKAKKRLLLNWLLFQAYLSVGLIILIFQVTHKHLFQCHQLALLHHHFL